MLFVDIISTYVDVLWQVTLELDDTRLNLRLTDVGEEESEGSEDGIQEGSHKSGPDAMDMVEEDIVDAEDWSNEPDDKDVDEGEENSPDESQRDSQDASDDSVQPQSDVSEDDECQSPDELESLSDVSLSQNVLEVEVYVAVDLSVISINDVQSRSEVSSSDERRGSRLPWFLYLLLPICCFFDNDISSLVFQLDLLSLSFLWVLQKRQGRLVQVALWSGLGFFLFGDSHGDYSWYRLDLSRLSKCVKSEMWCGFLGM